MARRRPHAGPVGRVPRAGRGMPAGRRAGGSTPPRWRVCAGSCRPELRVLTGLPLAQRWPELRPAGVEAVLATGRSMADFDVVDCGFCLETDEELSFDTVAPRRNGATLAVLDAADLVLAVGSADPIGMQRLIRGLADLRDTGLDRTVASSAQPSAARCGARGSAGRAHRRPRTLRRLPGRRAAACGPGVDRRGARQWADRRGGPAQQRLAARVCSNWQLRWPGCGVLAARADH